MRGALSREQMGCVDMERGEQAVPSSRLPSARLGPVLVHIEQNLDGNLGLEALAAAARMSPFHFARQFKQAIGRTPHQYVIGARVRRAIEILRNEDSSLSDVAYRCGFSNQSHFTTVFRREVGSTPHSFRTLIEQSETEIAS